MLKENIKTVISINIDNDKLVFSCLEISKSFDIVLKGYCKIKNSSDIFNNISQAIIKATNGKKAKFPIKKVDEIMITNRMLTMTLARINKIKSKKTDMFYKPKHLKGVLKGLIVSDLETGIDFDKIGEDLYQFQDEQESLLNRLREVEDEINLFEEDYRPELEEERKIIKEKLKGLK